MNFIEFIFEPAPLNSAIDDLMAHTRTMKDKNGSTVWLSVERGLAKPPSEFEMPAIRVFHNPKDHDILSVQMFDAEISTTVSFLIYLYGVSDDRTVIQLKREELILALLKHLEYPEAGISGLTPPNSWWFENPQVIQQNDAEIGQEERKSFNQPENIYITRVSFRVRVKNN